MVDILLKIKLYHSIIFISKGKTKIKQRQSCNSQTKAKKRQEVASRQEVALVKERKN